MSCHETEAHKEQLYDDFCEAFSELENDMLDYLESRGELDMRLVGAVLSKHLVAMLKYMGEDKEMMLELMGNTWDSVIEVEEVH
tara:strand:+ start:77 stop:328 length:252 start_codon:yes stop_codon:yes gene_type:complete